MQRGQVAAPLRQLSEQNDLRAHFGLAEAASADRIEVVWPSGRTETLTNVSANQIISIKEGNGIVAHKPFSR